MSTISQRADWTTVKCVLCGSSATSEIFKISPRTSHGAATVVDFAAPVSILKCGKCQTEFCWPRPSIKDLVNFYSTGLDDSDTHISRYFDEKSRLQYGGFREAKFVLERIQRFVPPPAKICDVACGNGWHLATAKENGYQVLGVEINTKAIDVSKRVMGLNASEIEEAAIETWDLEGKRSGQFDVVIISQALEHVLSPVQWLEKAVSLLRPDGLLVIAVPNHEGLEARLLKARYSLYCPPEHLNYFVLGSFSEIARIFGLRLEALFTRSMYDLNVLKGNKAMNLLRFGINLLIDTVLVGHQGRFLYAFLRK